MSVNTRNFLWAMFTCLKEMTSAGMAVSGVGCSFSVVMTSGSLLMIASGSSMMIRGSF